MEAVMQMEKALDVLDLLPFEINLWTAQNMAYDVLRLSPTGQNEEWRRASAGLARRLGVAAE
jgi:hypothetical protein